MNQKQKGFAVLESLLILIIIAIISGTGWYAWQTKSQADKTLSQANQTSQNSPVPVILNTGTSKESNDKLSYLDISCYKVKMALPGSISDLYYYYPLDCPGPGAFGVKSLDSVPGCKPSVGERNVITGVATLSIDIYDSMRIKDGGNPDKSGFKDNPNAVRVGNNYFEVDAFEGCKSDDPQTQKTISQLQSTLEQAGKTIIKQ